MTFAQREYNYIRNLCNGYYQGHKKYFLKTIEIFIQFIYEFFFIYLRVIHLFTRLEDIYK